MKIDPLHEKGWFSHKISVPSDAIEMTIEDAAKLDDPEGRMSCVITATLLKDFVNQIKEARKG